LSDTHLAAIGKMSMDKPQKLEREVEKKTVRALLFPWEAP
jgi:hypothetical protein